MREIFDHDKSAPQAMVYSENDPNFAVRGKPKGAESPFCERGLWPLNGLRSEGCGVNLREQSHRFVNVDSGHLMAGALRALIQTGVSKKSRRLSTRIGC